MSFFEKLLVGAIKSLLTETDTANSSNLLPSQQQQNPQSESYATPGTFLHDHANYCKWCEITDLNTRKKVIAEHLLTLNTVSNNRLQANLEQMKRNVLSHLNEHEANEKYAWGRYIEDQIAYQNSKLSTGARDPEFVRVLNDYKLSLETISWTIQVCRNLWDEIKRH
ncbi:MAG: hypothetical protein ABI729_07010 [Chitinophagales bacterium]